MGGSIRGFTLSVISLTARSCQGNQELRLDVLHSCPMAKRRSWFSRLRRPSGGRSSYRRGSGFDSFRKGLQATFSVPQPEAEALRQFVKALSGFSTQQLPRDKKAWLSLLVESPFLAGPVRVYRDEFAKIGYQLLQPRNQGAIANALEVNALPAGRCRFDLVGDMIAAGSLVPVPPDHPLNKIMGPNVRGLTGRRLRWLTIQHYITVGEAFWRLGSSSNTLTPDEAITIVPTDVIQLPRPGRDVNYRLTGSVGEVSPEEIFEWNDPDPRDIYRRGRGVVQALGDEIESAEFMSRTLGTFFRNNNVPPSIMFYRGDEDAQAMEKKFDRKHRGLLRRARMAFQRILNTHGPVRDQYAIEKMGEALDPQKASEYARWAWEFVRQYLRVPPSLVANYNDNSGLGTSGIELERMVFLMSVMEPIVEDFEDTLQDLARRVYDERLVVRHAPFVETDREFRLRVIEAFPGIFMNDEKRALGGFSNLDDEASGKAFMVKRGQLLLEDLRPGNESLEKAAQGSRRDDSESGLPEHQVNGSGPRFTRGQENRLRLLPGQISGIDQRLDALTREVAERSLRR